MEFAVLLHLQELVVGDAATEAGVALLLQGEEVVEVLSGVLSLGGGGTVSHTKVIDLLDVVSRQVLHKRICTKVLESVYPDKNAQGGTWF